MHTKAFAFANIITKKFKAALLSFSTYLLTHYYAVEIKIPGIVNIIDGIIFLTIKEHAMSVRKLQPAQCIKTVILFNERKPEHGHFP
ncbi:hypothetical protein DSBG_3110 [Desulfosporosinus sp. BG]|nr:hypothetical protein DSBG_3110 [Desulfosporosinus sp. BG]